MPKSQAKIKLPFLQMTGYAKKFNENARMSFRVRIKYYDKIWEKVEKLLKINFESKPVYGDDDKYIRTKIRKKKKYYPHIFLEGCKYLHKNIKTENYVDVDLEKSESDSDSNDESESDIDNDEYGK